jgi:hypothetical protein
MPLEVMLLQPMPFELISFKEMALELIMFITNATRKKLGVVQLPLK